MGWPHHSVLIVLSWHWYQGVAEAGRETVPLTTLGAAFASELAPRCAGETVTGDRQRRFNPGQNVIQEQRMPLNSIWFNP